MAKNSRKNKKSKIKNGFFSKKKIAIVILSFFVSFTIVYGINYFQALNPNIHEEDNPESTQMLMHKMKKMLDDEKKRLDELPKYIQPKKVKKLPPVVSSITKEIEKDNHLSEIKDYKKSLEKTKNIDKKLTKTIQVEKKKYKYSGKPKLAIIIDDVAFAHQIKLIKKIPYKVTPSFFPPTKRHPDTIKLEKDFAFSMIHLPTEAISFGRPEPETLMVTDSIDKIRKRIRQIKKWFPKIEYYNNHTGSKFTADYKSMENLIKVMKEEKLYFVDSRTTASTKGPKLAKKYNVHLYSRDIFIDNDAQMSLIKKQLRKAIAIAKKRGYAVAIGHPHQNTLKVLIGAKNMLKDVELVYLKDL